MIAGTDDRDSKFRKYEFDPFRLIRDTDETGYQAGATLVIVILLVKSLNGKVN